MKNIKNENAVSPVIGVILMVVITVIIAAVLAVFAFGVGAPSKGPQASLKIVSVDTTAGSETVTIQHYGGDPVRLVDTRLIIDQIDATGAITSGVYDTIGAAADGELKAGDKVTIGATADSILVNGVAPSSWTPLVGSTGALVTGNSVAVTVINIPSGNVLSKPTVRI